MDEIGLYFIAHPDKTLAQGKVKGWKLQQVCNTCSCYYFEWD